MDAVAAAAEETTRLSWGLEFNLHTHPIPTEKPVGIPTESPRPQNQRNRLTVDEVIAESSTPLF